MSLLKKNEEMVEVLKLFAKHLIEDAASHGKSIDNEEINQKLLSAFHANLMEETLNHIRSTVKGEALDETKEKQLSPDMDCLLQKLRNQMKKEGILDLYLDVAGNAELTLSPRVVLIKLP